jgi:demethylmenaquinone methyltransferase/2-methoxy-6-polyprenyl-1,4-benzoquinol methylase
VRQPEPGVTTSQPLPKDVPPIATMFDAIAKRYDLLNHLLSAGCDRRWRRLAIATLGLTGKEIVLDVCTGTGALALTARQGGTGAKRVIGVDFSPGMLRIADEKVRRAKLGSSIHLVRGDASRLPVFDTSVDAVTIAFGIRNVRDRVAACAEMHRVLRVGGRLVVLEFSLPRVPGLREVYMWYFRRVLPLIGRLMSGHPTAYSYLPASVGAFASPDQVTHELRSIGFGEVEAVPLSFGIVYMFTAVKAAGDRPTASTRTSAARRPRVGVRVL